MKILNQKSASVLAVAFGLLLGACSSTSKEMSYENYQDDGVQVAGPVKGSEDILELLTGFGEAISRRNFERAVAYLVPDDRAQILDTNGNVPDFRQKDLLNLPLQRLIRTPTVNVQNKYLSGIFDLLPSNRLKAEAKGSTVSKLEAGTSPAAASN